jgi:hypothetical protein
MVRTRRFVIVSLAAAVSFAACSPFGPGNLRSDRFDYSGAIAQSWDEQLLLNLVRLRYRDTPQFVQVGSVLSRYTRSAGSSAAATFGVEGTSRTSTVLGGALGYEESPTITFVPLQGEEFTRHLLTPIGAQPLFLLAQSGWSVERLLRCCAQQINGIRNAPSTAGPTPVRGDDAAEFVTLAALLREMQVDGTLASLVAGADGAPSPTFDGQPRFVFGPIGQPLADGRIVHLRSMLRLNDQCTEFPVRAGLGSGEGCAVVLQTRSLLGVMFFLSLGVEVPQDHLERGLVTRTVDEKGAPYEWSRLVGNLLRVRCSDREVDAAFVQVRYRGKHWYLADDDLESKSTFFLLTWLFNLQATSQPGVGPMLTVGTR